MSNELIKFESSSIAIRVVEIDGEPWFVAKDVAEALEYAESSNPARLFANIPNEWKGVNRIHTLGGIQEMLILSEQGLYFFICRSDKPKALPFQMWLAGEVLPALRKRGHYGLLKPTERLRCLAALGKTAKQLEGAKQSLSQTVLIQALEEIYAMLRLKMPAITLAQGSSQQLPLEENMR